MKNLIKIIPILICGMILSVTCIELAETTPTISENPVKDPSINFQTDTSDKEIAKRVKIEAHFPINDQWITIYDKPRHDENKWSASIPYPKSADKLKIKCSCEGIGKPDGMYTDRYRRWSAEITLPEWNKNKNLDVKWWTKWKSGVEFNKGDIDINSAMTYPKPIKKEKVVDEKLWNKGKKYQDPGW